MTTEVAIKVLNLIRNPPEDKPYQRLEDRLVRSRKIMPPSCLGCTVSYLLVTSLVSPFELLS